MTITLNGTTGITTTGLTSTGIDDNATSTAITIDASENVGIGKAPESWGNTWTALDVSYGASLASYNSGGFPNTWIVANGYNDNTDWRAMDTDQSCAIDLLATTGTIRFLNTTTNTTAGNAFTWNETMRIDSSGNVGIGTTSPNGKLDITGSGNTDIYLNTGNNSGDNNRLFFGDTADIDVGYLSYDHGTNTMSFGVNTAERMRIDTNGNLGIGTTANANTRVYVRTALATDVAYLADNSTNSGFKVKFNSGSTAILNDFNAPLLLGTNDTERMRIDSSGNLLVGCSAVPSGSTPGFAVRDLNNGWIHTSYDSTGVRSHHIFYNPNGVVGTIQTSGSSTLYNTSSDQRLKDNIVDAPAGNIDAIRVRSFDWKADGSHQTYGMVAQELVDVAPEAVSQGETEDDMWGVDYSKLVPMMIKEIQELKAKVTALEAR